MNPEMLNTIFSGLTFVVIALTAIAALRQLQHLRSSNQLSALITVLEDWQKPEMQQWIKAVRHDFKERFTDPDYLRTIVTPINREVHPWVNVCDYYEQLGSYMKYGLIDKASYLDVSSSPVSSLYRLMEPGIEALRKISGPATYENFEYLAVLGCEWQSKFPNGAWPHGLKRFRDVDPMRAEAGKTTG